VPSQSHQVGELAVTLRLYDRERDDFGDGLKIENGDLQCLVVVVVTTMAMLWMMA
jgi:hypothetical protein